MVSVFPGLVLYMYICDDLNLQFAYANYVRGLHQLASIKPLHEFTIKYA